MSEEQLIEIVLTEKNTADEFENGTGNVPGVVVSSLAHVLAVDQVECDQNQNEGKQVDSSLNGIAATSKLVVQGKVVDADEGSKGGKH